MLSIIIVSWNTRDLLRNCLESLRATHVEPAIEVIVVDNGSDDGTPQMVRDEFPEVTLIASEENLGYTGGNNLGLARARGVYLLLLNPDTEIAGDALQELVQFLEARPYVGVVGPRLLYGDGRPQPSRRRFPNLPTLFLESTRFGFLLGPLLRRYYMLDHSADDCYPVDWLVGAALLLRREVYESAGGLDERFFMYFEEVDWQRRMKADGWSIWYVPSATVIHHEGASSGQVVAKRHILFNRSRIAYCEKWHGRHVAVLLRFWLLLLFLMEAAIELAKWTAGHKRTLRASRLREYATVVGALAR